MERRDFLRLAGSLAALGVLSGCGQPTASLPDAEHPTPPAPPTPPKSYGKKPAFPDSSPPRAVSAISRSVWGARPPIASKLNPMGGVTRITIHHEGNPRPNYDVTSAQVAATLRMIQLEHRRRMNAADIGYHYIIDRSGRVWEGRKTCYQGAHVSGANEHNIGVMLLGNFEIQTPTAAQTRSLQDLCRMLTQGYRLPASRIYCHRDLATTRCPGRALVPTVSALRWRLA